MQIEIEKETERKWENERKREKTCCCNGNTVLNIRCPDCLKTNGRTIPGLWGDRRGSEMIPAHMASGDLNMRSFVAVWTHFKQNP